MSRRDETAKDRLEWPASGQPHRMAIARTTVAYWRRKVLKVTGRGGIESPHFSARIGHQKRRERFPLLTPNKEAAAVKAAQIFGFLLDNGWDATLKKYKPHVVRELQAEHAKPHSVGALIEANQKYSTAREQSLHAYVKALRRVVAGVMQIEDGQKYQSRGACGTEVWRQRIDAVSLHDLTPGKIQTWKQEFLQKANRASKRQAVTTVNSLIRNAKALFSKKLLPFLERDLDLPAPLPFEGVPMEKPPSQRYRSRIDAKKILANAYDGLKDEHPEAYKILLLAGVCGLRVSEIDWLPWAAFDFQAGILEIQDTEHHQLKSEDSTGELALSEDMQVIFKTYAEQATGEFVIESNGTVKRSGATRSYRCQRHIDVLKTWLRDQGIKAQKPIHELRKEIGSVIASEEGIFAASRYLRHSDIRITSAIYADQKKRITPSIGDSLLPLS